MKETSVNEATPISGECDQALDYLYSMLDGDAKARFETHLGTCARCQAELESFGRVRVVAQAALPALQAAEESARLNGPLHAQLMHAASTARPKKGRVLPFVRRVMSHPGYAVAATVLIIGGAAGVQLTRGHLFMAAAPKQESQAIAPVTAAAPAPGAAAQDPTTGKTPSPDVHATLDESADALSTRAKAADKAKVNADPMPEPKPETTTEAKLGKRFDDFKAGKASGPSPEHGAVSSSAGLSSDRDSTVAKPAAAPSFGSQDYRAHASGAKADTAAKPADSLDGLAGVVGGDASRGGLGGVKGGYGSVGEGNGRATHRSADAKDAERAPAPEPVATPSSPAPPPAAVAPAPMPAKKAPAERTARAANDDDAPAVQKSTRRDEPQREESDNKSSAPQRSTVAPRPQAAEMDTPALAQNQVNAGAPSSQNGYTEDETGKRLSNKSEKQANLGDSIDADRRRASQLAQAGRCDEASTIFGSLERSAPERLNAQDRLTYERCLRVLGRLEPAQNQLDQMRNSPQNGLPKAAMHAEQRALDVERKRQVANEVAQPSPAQRHAPAKSALKAKKARMLDNADTAPASKNAAPQNANTMKAE